MDLYDYLFNETLYGQKKCDYCGNIKPIKPGKPHKCYAKCKIKNCDVVEKQIIYNNRRYPCSKHRCAKKKCFYPKLDDSIYCKLHRNKERRKRLICLNCGKLPFDFVFLGILYLRKVISKDVRKIRVFWLRRAYIQHEIKLLLENKPYYKNYRTGNTYPQCSRLSFTRKMCQEHFDQIEIPGPLKRYRFTLRPTCENCGIERKPTCSKSD